MPRANGYDLNAKRISRDSADFDVRHDGERARGPLPMRVLIATIKALKDGKVEEAALLLFLQGGDTEVNLMPGKEPISLDTFLFEHFLPKEKRPNVAKSTYDTAIDEAKRLVKTLEKIPIHQIRQSHAKFHKDARKALKKADISTRQDLNLLSQAMAYAVECGLIEKNYLLPVKGLAPTDRRPIWLRLKDIVTLMRCLPREIKALAYFLILSGARISEALAVKVEYIDWEERTIKIPNAKRRMKTPSRAKKFRTLNIDDLGPRFEWLLKKIIKPGPKSGFLFPGRFDTKPLDRSTAEDLFHKGVMKANLGHLIPEEVAEKGGHEHVIAHDCRGTMVNHALQAGWSDQKLRVYLGQLHGQSIQSYRDEAESHDPAGSIFVHPPLRVRRAKQHAGDSRAPAQDGAQLPAILPASSYLN